MIRVLAIIAVTGFLLSVICIAGAVGLAGQAIARGDVDSRWTSFGNWDNDNDRGPVVELNGVGPLTTRQVDWNGSDKLTVNVPSEVTYTQGPKAGVTLSGPSDLLDRIEIENGQISLRGFRSRNYRSNAHLTITVQAPGVTHFEFNGAQKVEIRDYNQDELDIEVNGSADLDGAGRAKSLNLQLNGASKVDLSDLKLEDADIEMNGASDVTAGPTEAADVEINGVGQATLLGRPKTFSRSIHGLGSVNVRDVPAPVAVKGAEKARPSTGDEKAKTP